MRQVQMEKKWLPYCRLCVAEPAWLAAGPIAASVARVTSPLRKMYCRIAVPATEGPLPDEDRKERIRSEAPAAAINCRGGQHGQYRERLVGHYMTERRAQARTYERT